MMTLTQKALIGTVVMWLFAFAAFALAIALGGPAHAFTINSQGASGAPISVTNAVAKVLPCTANRTHWLICPETVAIRCTTGPIATGCGVGSPVPSTTVGFFVSAGTCLNADYLTIGSTNITGIWSAEVDCFSTGAATNVDTTEFP